MIGPASAATPLVPPPLLPKPAIVQPVKPPPIVTAKPVTAPVKPGSSPVQHAGTGPSRVQPHYGTIGGPGNKPNQPGQPGDTKTAHQGEGHPPPGHPLPGHPPQENVPPKTVHNFPPNPGEQGIPGSPRFGFNRPGQNGLPGRYPPNQLVNPLGRPINGGPQVIGTPSQFVTTPLYPRGAPPGLIGGLPGAPGRPPGTSPVTASLKPSETTPSKVVPVAHGRIGTIEKPTAAEQTKAASALSGVSVAPVPAGGAGIPAGKIVSNGIVISPSVVVSLPVATPIQVSSSQSFSGTLVNGKLVMSNGQTVTLVPTSPSAPAVPGDPMAGYPLPVAKADPTAIPPGAILSQSPPKSVNGFYVPEGGMTVVSVIGPDGKKTAALGSSTLSNGMSSMYIGTAKQLDDFYTSYYNNFTPAQFQKVAGSIKPTDPGYTEFKNIEQNFDYNSAATARYSGLTTSQLQTMVSTISSPQAQKVADAVLIRKYEAQYKADPSSEGLEFNPNAHLTSEQLTALQKTYPPGTFSAITVDSTTTWDPKKQDGGGSGGPGCDMCANFYVGQPSSSGGPGSLALNSSNDTPPKLLAAEQALVGVALGGSAGVGAYVGVTIGIGMLSAAMALVV